MASKITASGMGAFIGWNVAFHGMLAFVFITQPGKWMFGSLSFGQAIVAFGYTMMLWWALCLLIGTYGPSIVRLIAARLRTPS